MPELPEATTISLQLKKYLNIPSQNLFLKKIIIHKGSIIKNPDLKFQLLNRKLEEVSNYGKIVYFKFTDNYWILFHLALTGAILIKDFLSLEKLEYFEKYKIIEFIFESSLNNLDNNNNSNNNGLIESKHILFCAKRLFEKVIFIQDENPFKKYGIPFNKLKNIDFIRILSKSKKPIKEALMDQNLIVGIGNIYAIESLFCAGISPFRLASNLTVQEYYKLYNCIKEILKESILNRGSSVRCV